ncbi:transcriptional regulator [Catenovulum agarivorans DS-2]|uniref:Transcriptional regulator n=1 Tax=Catenovulum agarivorans DS-2 TaxID=1328313 RepID=W7Q9V7_9ALTE|nr:helix-turn-helix transcriptional regulator [Catenovulum agarivorans]EWH08771.1 transcriptional regulator [Catenovulum agarivorans DS-2]
MSFADRLKSLIGEESVSGFARRVGLNEALIRKYLNGSEPSLAKANQIAERANCSLEYLATGCGYLYRHAEVVDAQAAKLAHKIVYRQSLEQTQLNELTKMISAYQYLRTHKKPDGYLDQAGAERFLQVAASKQ